MVGLQHRVNPTENGNFLLQFSGLLVDAERRYIRKGVKRQRRDYYLFVARRLMKNLESQTRQPVLERKQRH